MPSWLNLCKMDSFSVAYLLDSNQWIPFNGGKTELPVTAAATWVQSAGQGASPGRRAPGGGGVRAATEGQTVACRS